MRQPYWRRHRTWTWRNPSRFSKVMEQFRFAFKPLSFAIVTVMPNKKIQGVMYLLLLSMSAHLTKELGMAPGGEFRRYIF